MANSTTSPMTFGLIVEINQLLTSRGLTRERFLEEMNPFLPAKRRIKINHSGIVSINRWLNPTGNHWVEPKGEIVLAMQLAVKKLQKSID